MGWELQLAKDITHWWASNSAANFLTYPLAIFTTLAEYGWGFILLSLILIFFKKTRRAGIISTLALLVFALLGNNVICKHIVARLRPVWEDTTNSIKNNAETIFLPVEQRIFNLDFWALPKPTSYSFMSGHTVAGFVASTAIFMRHKKIGLISFIVAAIIAFSRIYFGFHYVSDVLAGALYGIMGGLITYFAYTKIFEYVARKTNEKNEKDNGNA